jgi:DNA-binding LacI/PurR family transcriptional regulator
MPVTQEDIAQKLGVSRVLVGYALNGNSRGRISPDTRRRIQETAQQLGYQPNQAARALVTGRSYQITLCLPALGNSFYSEIIRQFENLTHDTPYDLVVITTARFQKRGGAMAGDGTIIYGSGSMPVEMKSRPAVMIRHPKATPSADEDLNGDTVLLDFGDAAEQAMEHLIAQGFKRITYAGPASSMFPHEPRYRAYGRTMEAAGLEQEHVPIPISIEGRIREQTHAHLVQHFSAHGFPDALFCSNDDTAIGAYRALREFGKSIPDEVAVLGCDGISEGQDLTPTLSSIHLPLEEICRTAWQMLLARIELNETPPQSVTCSGHLVIRESSLNQRSLDQHNAVVKPRQQTKTKP